MTTPGEPAHRVAAHLGIEVAAYDAAIRGYIPGYEEMHAEVVSILGEALGERARAVDLGAGTGALAGAILGGIPRAHAVLVDIDPSMLDAAAARLAAHGERAELRCATFEDALTALGAGGADAVVASLALHHVREPEHKRALYARIHEALAPGGVFLMADATVHEAGAERARVYRVWKAGMARAGIAGDEAEALFAQWAGEDRYFPLAVELDLLAAAGFPRPECFWRRGPMTVYGGFR